MNDRDDDPDAEFDKEDIELSNNELQSLLDDRLIVYNNLAVAQIKEMYKKKLGQTVESSKLKLLGYLMGSILIGVAGVRIRHLSPLQKSFSA